MEPLNRPNLHLKKAQIKDERRLLVSCLIGSTVRVLRDKFDFDVKQLSQFTKELAKELDSL